MSEQPDSSGTRANPSRKLARHEALRRSQRLARLGCLPFAFLLTICLLLVVNLGLITGPPYWVSDAHEYLLSQRILGSLGTLAGIQLVGSWLLGLVGAVAAASAVGGQGGLLRQRLAVSRRRIVLYAWAVFLLRWIFLIALVVCGVLAYASLASFRLSWNDFRRTTGFFEVLALSVMTISVLLQWMFGPFLRLRYSMALGAVVAVWTRARDARRWQAITVRLAEGMLGAFALLWGGTLGGVVVTSIRQPFSWSRTADFHQLYFRFLPRDSWVGIVVLFGLSGLILAHMLAQLVLPSLYLWLARRRLAGSLRRDKHSRQSKGFGPTQQAVAVLASSEGADEG
jgi:hypothetical protein